MKCQKCSSSMESDWLFCPKCGTQCADATQERKRPGREGGAYGSGVRAQVFEVIVRQAMAGAPWRKICALPMEVNNISPDEIEDEIRRRRGDGGSAEDGTGGGGGPSPVPAKPAPTSGSGGNSVAPVSSDVQARLGKIVAELDQLSDVIRNFEQMAIDLAEDAQASSKPKPTSEDSEL